MPQVIDSTQSDRYIRLDAFLDKILGRFASKRTLPMGPYVHQKTSLPFSPPQINT
jgi:hypothetical protein